MVATIRSRMATGSPWKRWKLNNPIDTTSLSSVELEEIFRSIIISEEIGFVIFNHLIGFTPSLGLVLRAIGIGYSFALHDFFIVCDSINLLDDAGAYCKIDGPYFTKCEMCTLKRLSLTPDAQYIRRQAMRQFIRSASSVLANTNGMVATIEEILGSELPRPAIVPAPVPLHADGHARPRFEGGRLQVAVIGNLHVQKGSKDFAKIASMVADRDLPIDFVQVGDYDEHAAKVRNLDNVTLLGAYRPADPAIARRLAKCDCAIFLSKWPETYCMSLSEAMQIGLVPIAYAIGAFVERISTKFGVLVEAGDTEGVVDALTKLLNNPLALNLMSNELPSFAELDKFEAGYYSFLLNVQFGAASPNLPRNYLGARFTESKALPADSGGLPPRRKARRRIDGALIRAAGVYYRRHGLPKTVRRSALWLIDG